MSDTASHPDGYPFGGYEQEHNATCLAITLPTSFLTEEMRTLQVDFQTSMGETVISSPLTPTDNTLSVVLHQQLMQAGLLQFQVVARGADDRIIAKSAVGYVVIHKSTYGDPVVINEQPYRIDQEIVDCLLLAQQAAAEATAGKEEVLSLLPLRESNLANQAVSLPKLNENEYTVLRRLTLYIAENAGNELKGILNFAGVDMTKLAALVMIGQWSDRPAFPSHEAAYMNFASRGLRLAVTDTKGRHLKYAEIPAYGLYRFAGTEQVMLLDIPPQLGVMEVLTENINDRAVTERCLAEDSVANSHLQRDAVSEANIYNGAVSRDKIKDGAVNLNKLAVDVKEKLAGFAKKGELTDGTLVVANATTADYAQNAGYANTTDLANKAIWDFTGHQIDTTYATKAELADKTPGVLKTLDKEFEPSVSIMPNESMKLQEVTGTLDVSVTPAANNGLDNEWAITVPMGNTAYPVNFHNVHWGLGIAPTFAANTTTVCRLYYVGDTLCGEWVSV